jgi:pimeloyl-ACP methyl ester carboxylesterase
MTAMAEGTRTDWHGKHVVLFHGLEGAPTGRKLAALAEEAGRLGMTTERPDHRDTKDPAARLERARRAFGPRLERGGVVLAGSSQGGFVAAALAAEFPVDGLLLMAPALERPGYPPLPGPPRAARVLVVHGRGDDVTPLAGSRRFVDGHAGAVLVEVDDGHRLDRTVDLLPHLLRVLLAMGAAPPDPRAAAPDRV